MVDDICFGLVRSSCVSQIGVHGNRGGGGWKCCLLSRRRDVDWTNLLLLLLLVVVVPRCRDWEKSDDGFANATRLLLYLPPHRTFVAPPLCTR